MVREIPLHKNPRAQRRNPLPRHRNIPAVGPSNTLPQPFTMVLKPVSTLDILVFLFFLTVHILCSPHLLLAIHTVLRALPFLLFELPAQLFKARWQARSRFTLFQDVVLRCVKWAFREMSTEGE
jgi:hypothetical protein